MKWRLVGPNYTLEIDGVRLGDKEQETIVKLADVIQSVINGRIVLDLPEPEDYTGG